MILKELLKFGNIWESYFISKVFYLKKLECTGEFLAHVRRDVSNRGKVICNTAMLYISRLFFTINRYIKNFFYFLLNYI